jgi:uncharacterized membrane protein YcaP (DUF421 family)
MEENFRVFDFHRIFIGDAPGAFFLEIIFRTFIMYAYTVFLLRLLGKREMGQLSVLELAIIISFGSAVGDPMIGASMPILYGVVAITTIALLQMGLETLVNKNKKVEAVMEGAPELVVDHGSIMLEGLKKENLSKEDLFRALRGKDVKHLGEVQKAFVETTGEVSVLFNAPKNIKPGLSVLPENQLDETKVVRSKTTVPEPGEYCCMNCGAMKTFHQQRKAPSCDVCSGEEWVKAIH